MTPKPLELLRRGKVWKSHVEQNINAASDRLAAIQRELDEVRAANAVHLQHKSELQSALDTLRKEIDGLSARQRFTSKVEALGFQKQAIVPLGQRVAEVAALGDRYHILMSQRGAQLLVLFVKPDDPALSSLRGTAPLPLLEAAIDGRLREAIIVAPNSAGGHAAHRSDELMAAITQMPFKALAWAETRGPANEAAVASGATLDYFARLNHILADLDRLDFHAHGSDMRDEHGRVSNAPFNEPSLLPDFVPAQPRRRAVLFTHHAYYNFYYLARALRNRGWDALSISTESPSNPNRKYYHGDDLTIFDPDPDVQKNNIHTFLKDNADRFGIIHSYGIGVLSLFPSNHANSSHTSRYPWDTLEAKRRGTLIGYTHSGCHDGVSQSSFKTWSPSTCANCPWQNEPTICSDTLNLEWGRKLTSVVDLFCTETDPPLDFKGSKKSFRAPLTFAIDPGYWSNELEIPQEYVRPRKQGEVVVYHAMGNYELRSREGLNVKGTGAVVRAVQQLQGEGINIKLDFVKDIPSLDNRFIQAQADIIVDQLNYGRYGALAREGMMLGKPVVGRVNKMDGTSLPATRCILDSPIVNADETTITNVLRDLALNPAKRRAVGKDSREHAIQWWSGERLAERFERVYDHLREHGSPPSEDEIL